MATITANVWNVGEVYDEIDSLLDEIERDEDVRAVAIYTLNGLFASLPIR
jgi:enoyl-CoA hydratase/carnithine racemase